MRTLDASIIVKIVVSVSLLFFVFSLVPILFPPQGRRSPGFLDPDKFTFGEISVTYHDAITVVSLGP